MRKVRRFQDHRAFPRHLAKTDLVSQLPQQFVQFGDLLARARTRSFKQNDLGFACNIIAKLASFEAMNTGFYCKFGKSILVPKIDGNENVYLIKDCTIMCQEYELEEVRRNIENTFFEKYRIRIKLELNINSQKSESFFIERTFAGKRLPSFPHMDYCPASLTDWPK